MGSALTRNSLNALRNYDPGGRFDEAFAAREVHEAISLSTHPAVVGGGLEPRHVGLRVSSLKRAARLPGRPAGVPAALIANSSMNGGGKDTWMLR